MGTMELINEMRIAKENGELRVLTISDAEALIGRRIQTLYIGYKGQDGVDDFTIGSVISEWDYYKSDIMEDGRSRTEYWQSYMKKERIDELKNTMLIITDDGRNTAIKSYEGVFTCSDIDRIVYFRTI